MESNKKNRYLWLAIVFLVLTLVLFYWNRLFQRPIEDYIPWLQQISAPSPQASPEQENLTENEALRRKILNDIAAGFRGIVPSKNEGADWKIIRAWFIDNNNVYIEYGDGITAQRQILLGVDNKGEMLQYTPIALFEAGESDWELIEGEDPFFGEPRDLYEYAPDKEGKFRWIKRN